MFESEPKISLPDSLQGKVVYLELEFLPFFWAGPHFELDLLLPDSVVAFLYIVKGVFWQKFWVLEMY